MEDITVFTVKEKVVVRVSVPAVPVIVIGYVPTGVAAEALIVSVEVHGGLQLVGENEAGAPVGRPEVVKETDCAVPETRDAVIVFVTDEPFVTERAPPLVREKLKEVGGADDTFTTTFCTAEPPD